MCGLSSCSCVPKPIDGPVRFLVMHDNIGYGLQVMVSRIVCSQAEVGAAFVPAPAERQTRAFSEHFDKLDSPLDNHAV